MPTAMSSDTALSPTGSSADPGSATSVGLLLGLDGEPLRFGVLTSGGDDYEIGRASCRERV